MSYAEQVMQGENPIVPFADTYAMHRAFRIAGLFAFRSSMYLSWHNLRYRVDHGGGYITQNTWMRGQHNPHITEAE